MYTADYVQTRVFLTRNLEKKTIFQVLDATSAMLLEDIVLTTCENARIIGFCIATFSECTVFAFRNISKAC